MIKYNTIPRDKRDLHHTLCLDKHGTWRKYTKPENITVMSSARQVTYRNYEDFDDEVTLGDLIALHEEFFRKAPTKKLQKDRAELSLIIWHHLCNVADDRTTIGQTEAHTDDNGNRRRQSLADREYTVRTVEDLPKALSSVPPQARVCYQILADICEQQDSVSEQALMGAVAQASEQGRLKTKQDPWRIFQYYRPKLVEHNLITHD
jgi:hypothetical protein